MPAQDVAQRAAQKRAHHVKAAAIRQAKREKPPTPTVRAPGQQDLRNPDTRLGRAPKKVVAGPPRPLRPLSLLDVLTPRGATPLDANALRVAAGRSLSRKGATLALKERGVAERQRAGELGVGQKVDIPKPVKTVEAKKGRSLLGTVRGALGHANDALGIVDKALSSVDVPGLAQRLLSAEIKYARKRSTEGGADVLTSGIGVGTGGLNRVVTATALNTAIVAAEHPGKVAASILKGGADAIHGLTALPIVVGKSAQELATTGKSPTAAKFAGAVAKDYSRRYGAEFRGEHGAARAARKRMEREGIFPELADLTIVAPGAGAAAGKLATFTAKTTGRANFASRLLAAERAPLRVSGGIVKAQPTSKNLIKAAVEHKIQDKAREVIGHKINARRAASGKLGALQAAAQPGELTSLTSHLAQRRVAGKLAGSKLAKQTARVIGKRRHEQQLLIAQELRSSKPIQVRSLEGKIVTTASLAHELKRLTPEESRAYALAKQLGIRSTSDIRGALELRAQQIRSHRVGIDASEMPVKEADTLANIEGLLAKSDHELRDQHFTKKLDSIVQEATAGDQRRAQYAPSVAGERAVEHAIRPQAAFLQVQRKVEETPAEFAKRKEALHEVVAAQQEKVLIAHHTSSAAISKEAQQAQHDLEAASKRWHELDRYQQTDEYTHASNLARKDEIVQEKIRARNQIEDATRILDLTNTTHRGLNIADEEAKLNALLEQRKQLTRDKVSDTSAQFREKVLASPLAKELRLAEGAYVPSMRHPSESKMAFTVGAAKAAAPARRSTLRNFELGREVYDPGVSLIGGAKNIREGISYKRAAELTNQHAIREVTATDGTRITFTPNEITWHKTDGTTETLDASAVNIDAAMLKANVDPNSYSFFDPGSFAQTSGNLGEVEGAATAARAIVDPGTPDAVATKSLGLVPIPRAVGNELKSQSTGLGSIARAFAATTGWQSIAVLGLSPSWAGFQVIANVIASATSPSSLLHWRANSKIYKEASPEVRREIDIATGQAISTDTVHGERVGLMAHAGQGVAARIWHNPKVRAQLQDPLGLFRFDRTQTHAFRRNFLVNELRKEKVIRMTADARELEALQARIQQSIQNPGTAAGMEQFLDLNRNGTLDRAANKLNDIMGDYTTYTAAERHVLKTSLMFYGYLRYSLRLLFYTLPVHHPAMTGIMANLGRLQADEVKDLIGPDLPYGLGKFFFKNGTMEIDLSRANPFLNAVTQLDSPGRLLSAVPPIWSALAESVLFGKDLYKNRDFNVLDPNGFRTSLADYEKIHGTAFGKRASYFADKLASSMSPYRIAKKLTVPEHGIAGSSLWNPQIPKETSPALISAFAQQKADKPPLLRGILQEVIPAYPRPADITIKQGARATEEKARLKAQEERRATRWADPLERAKIQRAAELDRLRKQLGIPSPAEVKAARAKLAKELGVTVP